MKKALRNWYEAMRLEGLDTTDADAVNEFLGESAEPERTV